MSRGRIQRTRAHDRATRPKHRKKRRVRRREVRNPSEITPLNIDTQFAVRVVRRQLYVSLGLAFGVLVCLVWTFFAQATLVGIALASLAVILMINVLIGSILMARREEAIHRLAGEEGRFLEDRGTDGSLH